MYVDRNAVTLTKTGLSGWLDPDGEFHPCDYQHHHEKAQEIVYANEELNRKRLAGEHIQTHDRVLKMDLWIPMGSLGPGFKDCSYVHFSREEPMTKAQQTWFEAHLSELDEVQVGYYNTTLEWYKEFEWEIQ